MLFIINYTGTFMPPEFQKYFFHLDLEAWVQLRTENERGKEEEQLEGREKCRDR